MKKTKKILLGVPAITVLLFTLLALRPIYNPSLEDSEKVIGTVEKIEQDDANGDISIFLKSDETQYYINRGKFQGLKITVLRNNLLNEEVSLYFAKHWTPLDPLGKHKHITKLMLAGETIYDETGK